MKWTNYTTRDSQADDLAVMIANQINHAIETKGRASIAVPGGTTPAPFFQALSKQPVDWAKVTITLTDERQVLATDERSNALLLSKHFLKAVPQATFVPLFDADSVDALAHHADQLQSDVLPLDICILGMGTDGHTASLFPEARQLEAAMSLQATMPLSVIDADNIPEPRISLTLPAILSAQHVHLLICGDAKEKTWQQVTDEAEAGNINAMPVRALLKYADDKLTVHYAP